MEHIYELRNGLESAFINHSVNSNLAYRPEFVSNDYKQGKIVLSTIEQELMNCEEFFISVAFITLGGIAPLLQTMKELERKGIKGKIPMGTGMVSTQRVIFSEKKKYIA